MTLISTKSNKKTNPRVSYLIAQRRLTSLLVNLNKFWVDNLKVKLSLFKTRICWAQIKRILKKRWLIRMLRCNGTHLSSISMRRKAVKKRTSLNRILSRLKSWRKWIFWQKGRTIIFLRIFWRDSIIVMRLFKGNCPKSYPSHAINLLIIKNMVKTRKRDHLSL